MTAIPALQGEGGEALLTRFDETAGVAVVAVLVLAAAVLAFKGRTKTPAMRFVRAVVLAAGARLVAAASSQHPASSSESSALEGTFGSPSPVDETIGETARAPAPSAEAAGRGPPAASHGAWMLAVAIDLAVVGFAARALGVGWGLEIGWEPVLVAFVVYYTAMVWLAGQTIGRVVADLAVRRTDGARHPHALRGLGWVLSRTVVGYLGIDLLGPGMLVALAPGKAVRPCLDWVSRQEVLRRKPARMLHMLRRSLSDFAVRDQRARTGDEPDDHERRPLGGVRRRLVGGAVVLERLLGCLQRAGRLPHRYGTAKGAEAEPEPGEPAGQRLPGDTGAALSVAFAAGDAGDAGLASAGAEAVQLWDPGSGEPADQVLTSHITETLSVAFSAGGGLATSTTADQAVRLRDPETHEAADGSSLATPTRWSPVRVIRRGRAAAGRTGSSGPSARRAAASPPPSAPP